MNIGKRLHAVRKLIGISQVEAARRLHVTDRTIQRWENGESKRPQPVNQWQISERINKWLEDYADAEDNRKLA